MNTHEYEKIKLMIIRGSFIIIRVEKKLFIIIRVYLCSFVLKKNFVSLRLCVLKKFLIIRGSFMIIHVEKKIIYVYSCIFMLIRVEKKSLCSFVLRKNLYAHSC